MSNPIKTCPKCGTSDRSGNGRCKSCVKKSNALWRKTNPEKAKSASAKWVAKNTERVKELSSIWYSKNKEKVSISAAAYRVSNLEKLRAQVKAWRAANKDQGNACAAAYRAANPEKRKAAVSAWEKANPEAKRIIAQNRRARERKTGGVLSKGLPEKLFKLQRGKCVCCGLPLGNNYHMDHKMPLALGGLNVDGNIQLLRSTCNQKKHAKHPIDFMQERGFLL